MEKFIGFILAFLGVATATKTMVGDKMGIADVSENEVRLLAQTMWGEARNQGSEGMKAVANVIMNRVRLGQSSNAYARRFGATVEEVVKKPYQFSAWNVNDPNYQAMQNVDEGDPVYRIAKDIAISALRGELYDNSKGADHYLNVDLTRKINKGSLPSWVDEERITAKIQDHTFLKLA